MKTNIDTISNNIFSREKSRYNLENQKENEQLAIVLNNVRNALRLWYYEGLDREHRIDRERKNVYP